MSFHCYADDTQIYVPFKQNDNQNLSALTACLSDIKAWMSLNFLNLNESKTVAIVFGSLAVSGNIQQVLGDLAARVKPSVNNLGVVFDFALTFDKQVNAVVKSSFFQTFLKGFLTCAEFERAIHAFISSRLDYCNSMYIGISQSYMNHLQTVQNAAARLLTGTRKYEHITPVLLSLHWLPVHFKIEFKIVLLFLRFWMTGTFVSFWPFELTQSS